MRMVVAWPGHSGRTARGQIIARRPLVTIVVRAGRDARWRGDASGFTTSQTVGEATKQVNIAQRWGPEPATGADGGSYSLAAAAHRQRSTHSDVRVA